MTFFGVYGQTQEVKISGSVADMDKKSLSNVPVVLIENNDTIAIKNSDIQGNFSFELKISTEKDYYIFLDVAHQNFKHNWIKFHAAGDTNLVSEYHFDLLKLRIIQDRFDTGIYYELNEIKEYKNFDLAYFKKMVDEYPQMCIRFIQTLNPEEKRSVARRRKKHFLKELKTTGVNMHQIIFVDEILTLDITKSNNKRSRIEGVVYSMDGNCK